jgi:leader peptidase (prepilin peptidase) / N-methyltransferase
MTIAYAVLFGLAFGSFINAAIDRIPRGRSLNGHSACQGCGRSLRPWELVPVLSYIALRGRCASCGVRIGARTPVIEAASGAAFAAAFAGLSLPAAIVTCALFVVCVIVTGVAVERRGAGR